MHRVIMEIFLGRPLEKGEDVDHIDHDGLNNQIANLRLCNRSENLKNQRKRIGCSSIYKGVCWDKDANKWIARIRIDGKTKHLGRFVSEVEAAEAYKKAAKKYFGDFACVEPGLNIPVTLKINLVRSKTSRKPFNCSSKYKGIAWHKATQKWQAIIKMGEHRKHLGFFDNEVDAAKMYDRMAGYMYGDSYIPNLPATNYLTPEKVEVV